MRFYLDDLRDAPPSWERARTFDQGLRLLRAHRGRWEAMSLDHDLGDARGRTGFDFVEGLAEVDLWAPDIYVHSTNAAGRERMLEFIAAEDARRGLAPDRTHPVARPNDHTGCETTITCWYCPDEATDEPSEGEILRLATVGSMAVFGKSVSELASFADSIGDPMIGDDLASFAVIGKAAEDAGGGLRQPR